MSYLHKLLIPQEEVLHVARRSVAVTFGALIALLALLFAAAAALAAWGVRAGSARGWAGVVLVLLPLPAIAWRFLWWRHKIYVVTNYRVLKLEGIVSKSHRDAALDKINDMTLSQDLWGRLLGYGDLQISTANEASGVTYHYLAAPVEFKRRALEAREALAGAPPAGAAADDPISKLERLGELRDRNVITEEEFQAKKAELMDRIR